MDTRSHHLLMDLRGCPAAVLDDLGRVEAALVGAARAAGATVVGQVFHRFAPQGVSGVVLIAESHLSVHTWPEAGYAAVDFLTCGALETAAAAAALRVALEATEIDTAVVERGAGAMRFRHPA